MIFYIADMHFGYEDILSRANRPFATIEEMDAAIIANWNNAVSPEDSVYILGDLCHKSDRQPERYLQRLNGKKHLIRGNHDTGLDRQERLFEYFESISDFLEIDDGEHHITLCHYPIVYIQGGFMVHGHFHRTYPEIFELLKKLPRVMNAGVDINGYKPVTLTELIENNRIYYDDPTRGEVKKRWSPDGTPRRQKWSADFRPLPVKPEK